MASSYSFTTPTSNTTSNTAKQNLTQQTVDVTFDKIMEDINIIWKKLNAKQDKIGQDIQHLERMFNEYTTNPIFYQAKEILEQEKIANRQKLQTLEEQVYVVKRNCSSMD